MNVASSIGRRGLHRQLQGIQHAARIPIGHIHQMVQRLRGQMHLQPAIAALRVAQRLPRHLAQIVRRQRAQLEDAAAADQRLIHFKVRILGRGSDEDDGAIFHVRQQRVLLGLVPAVNLVYKQRGPLVIQIAPLLRLGNGFANLFNAS